MVYPACAYKTIREKRSCSRCIKYSMFFKSCLWSSPFLPVIILEIQEIRYYLHLVNKCFFFVVVSCKRGFNGCSRNGLVTLTLLPITAFYWDNDLVRQVYNQVFIWRSVGVHINSAIMNVSSKITTSTKHALLHVVLLCSVRYTRRFWNNKPCVLMYTPTTYNTGCTSSCRWCLKRYRDTCIYLNMHMMVAAVTTTRMRRVVVTIWLTIASLMSWPTMQRTTLPRNLSMSTWQSKGKKNIMIVHDEFHTRRQPKLSCLLLSSKKVERKKTGNSKIELITMLNV